MKGKDILIKQMDFEYLQKWLEGEGADYDIIDIKYAVSHSVMNAGYGSEANYYCMVIYTIK